MPSIVLTVMEFNTQFLIQWAFQIINTVIMVGILSLILYKPVLEFLKKRQLTISGQIDSAEARLAEAEQMKSEYLEKLSKIETECNEILLATRQKAQVRHDEIVAEAKEEAKKVLKRAQTEIEMEHAKALENLRTQVIELSTDIATLYITEKIDAKTQNKLLDEAIAGLGDVKWNK